MAESAERESLILEAAIATFARYGYRKTSMEEVARAAALSRQGLYLHYRSKEALFSAGVEYLFARSLGAAQKALLVKATLEQRLLGAFDAWHGQSIELFRTSPYLNELIEASQKLIGSLEARYVERFCELVSKALLTEGGRAGLGKIGVTVKSAAQLLHAASSGLKHGGGVTRAQYLESMGTAVRLVVVQLGNKKRG